MTLDALSSFLLYEQCVKMLVKIESLKRGFNIALQVNKVLYNVSMRFEYTST